MILADTSVWIGHLRQGSAKLSELLAEGRVLAHAFLIGELACGNLRNRSEVLSLLSALPQAKVCRHDEAMRFVSDRELCGVGLGWIDVHLLGSCLLSGCALWTNDRPLAAAARSLGVEA